MQIMSVRLMRSVVKLTIFIILFQVSLRSVSLSSLMSLCTYFVRQTEPKILRLVFLISSFVTCDDSWTMTLPAIGTER